MQPYVWKHGVCNLSGWQDVELIERQAFPVQSGFRKLLPIIPEYDHGASTCSYATLTDIFKCERFALEEWRREYRSRGKSPMGEEDVIYIDIYFENGAS